MAAAASMACCIENVVHRNAHPARTGGPVGATRALRGPMDHEELKKRTGAFARDVFAFTAPILHDVETQDAARQLRRAATSVAANYRSAGVGRSHKEFTARIGKVREEADETVYWLTHLKETGLAHDDRLLLEAIELKNIFDASYATA